MKSLTAVLSLHEKIKRLLFMRISHSMSFQLMHLLEDTHLEYKIKTIKKIADIVANLRSFVATGEGDYELGEYEIDNNLQ